jgi:hypothetical protein
MSSSASHHPSLTAVQHKTTPPAHMYVKRTLRELAIAQAVQKQAAQWQKCTPII